jgi:uncharacterized protein DUF6950
MRRLSNWRLALTAQIEKSKTLTFAWGSFDCALFACDCIRAQIGADPAAEFRGRYKTEAEAQALGSLSAIAEAMTARFGLIEISRGHAGRGDVVLIDNRTPQGALAIVDLGGRWAVCPGSRGLIRVGRHRWKRAWKV